MKDFKLFLILTTLFTGVFFIISSIFFEVENKDEIEEEFMEKSKMNYEGGMMNDELKGEKCGNYTPCHSEFDSESLKNKNTLLNDDKNKEEGIIDPESSSGGQLNVGGGQEGQKEKQQDSNQEENIELETGTGEVKTENSSDNHLEKILDILGEEEGKTNTQAIINNPPPTPEIKEEIKYTLESNKKVSYNYLPEVFVQEISKNLYDILTKTLKSNIFEPKIDVLKVNLNKFKSDVRGKMKKRNIYMFGVDSFQKEKIEEFTSVFVHEFGHYLDLYYFKRGTFSDISNKFYNISWLSTKVQKKGQSINDFVSGYAMTNKYEDFAESFTYFVLHNTDFLEKSKKSPILKQKYIFFNTYLFKNKKFSNSDFSKNNELKNYYRDITKIKINYKDFLHFLKK